MLSRLGIGTAQFGAAYGVSNTFGRPSETHIASILRRANDLGIGYLDTAAAYGDAEILVGRNLPTGHHMRIITKIPSISEARIEAPHRRRIIEAIERSLARLRADRVYGVIIHSVEELRKTGWEYLIEALREAQSRGWVGRVGASVYDAADLELVTNRWHPELIQLPLNILDRRLIDSGWINRLAQEGTEIHVRSAFLQGLLLMDPCELPEFFQPIREQIVSLRAQWARLGLSPVGACLSFILQHMKVDSVIVGVNRRAELDEIINALPHSTDFTYPEPLPNIDAMYLDPRRWPTIGH